MLSPALSRSSSSPRTSLLCPIAVLLVMCFGAPQLSAQTPGSSGYQQLVAQVQRKLTEGNTLLSRAQRSCRSRRSRSARARCLKALLKAALAFSDGYRSLIVSAIPDQELRAQFEQKLDELASKPDIITHRDRLEGELFSALERRELETISEKVEQLMKLDPRAPALDYAWRLVQAQRLTPSEGGN